MFPNVPRETCGWVAESTSWFRIAPFTVKLNDAETLRTRNFVLKNNYISNFQAGEELLDEPLLLKDMVRRTTKDGRPYILCTLGDKTGQLAGVFWDVPDSVDSWIQAGQVLYITGKVARYKDALQVNITDAYPDNQPDLSEFLPTSPRLQSEMVSELREMIGRLGEPYGRLVSHILLNEAFLTHYANSPAAKAMHHAYVGGLLDHSLSMAKLAETLAVHYPHVNHDLLVAGALLHDMGKVHEYNYQGGFEVSEDGRLVGHITRAAVMVELAAAQLGNVPARAVQNLLHLILSHHGTQEWGSPVIPKTLEAILLHQLDLLDSRVQGYFDHITSDGGDGSWTSKDSFMHKTILRRPDGWAG